MRPQALQHGRNQTVHFVLALPVEDTAQQQHHFAPLRPVDAAASQHQPVLGLIGEPGDRARGQVFLEGQVPKTDLAAAAHDDPAIHLLLVDERKREGATAWRRSIVEGGRQHIRGGALGDLQGTPANLVLHA